jgi:hypothetical protein
MINHLAYWAAFRGSRIAAASRRMPIRTRPANEVPPVPWRARNVVNGLALPS